MVGIRDARALRVVSVSEGGEKEAAAAEGASALPEILGTREAFACTQRARSAILFKAPLEGPRGRGRREEKGEDTNLAALPLPHACGFFPCTTWARMAILLIRAEAEAEAERGRREAAAEETILAARSEERKWEGRRERGRKTSEGLAEPKETEKKEERRGK